MPPRFRHENSKIDSSQCTKRIHRALSITNAGDSIASNLTATREVAQVASESAKDRAVT